MRQPAMLEIRKPSNRGKWQTPAEKPGGFEHHVDVGGTKRGDGRTVYSKRDCAHQACNAPIESRRLHNFNAGDAGQRGNLIRGIMWSGKQDGRNVAWAIPIERHKKIALVVVTTRPEPARDMGECDAERSMVTHAPAP